MIRTLKEFIFFHVVRSYRAAMFVCMLTLLASHFQQSSNTKLGRLRAILSVNSAKISDRGARSLFKTARLPNLHLICRIMIMQICLPGRPPENKGWGKTRVRGVIPSCQYLFTLGSYTQAFVNYFAQISSVFKNWIICVYLIQTALAALHKKIKEKKLLHKKSDVKLDFMFSQHEFFLNRGYFDIPEFNIETSSFKLKKSSLRS